MPGPAGPMAVAFAAAAVPFAGAVMPGALNGPDAAPAVLFPRGPPPKDAAPAGALVSNTPGPVPLAGGQTARRPAQAAAQSTRRAAQQPRRLRPGP